MDKKIVVFSGMPASGKDTVTEALCASEKRFIPFKKHRSVGSSDTCKDTYFNISVEEFERKIRAGEFLQYHGRYGRYYGIAEDTLLGYLQEDLCPIIHIGRIENYYAFCQSLPAFEKKYGSKVDVCHIQLWETKDVLHDRIVLRDKTETEIQKRLAAMEQEFADSIAMMNEHQRPFTVVIRNTDLSETCRRIRELLHKDGKQADDGYAEFWGYLRSL